MVDAAKKGDEVVTGGGLIGKVTKVTDGEVEIELAPNVKVRALKSTLASVTPRGAPAAANDAKA
jgi:preprotein translocase subunit YajC